MRQLRDEVEFAQCGHLDIVIDGNGQCAQMHEEDSGDRWWTVALTGRSYTDEEMASTVRGDDPTQAWTLLRRAAGPVPPLLDLDGPSSWHATHAVLSCSSTEGRGPAATAAMCATPEMAARLAALLNVVEAGSHPAVEFAEQRWRDLVAEIARQRAPMERREEQHRNLLHLVTATVTGLFDHPRTAREILGVTRAGPYGDVDMLDAEVRRLRGHVTRMGQEQPSAEDVVAPGPSGLVTDTLAAVPERAGANGHTGTPPVSSDDDRGNGS